MGYDPEKTRANTKGEEAPRDSKSDTARKLGQIAIKGSKDRK